jgi:hypothetical protein
MNIFILDRDIDKCTEYHTDKHCIKQILETAQILSTAHRVLDGIKSVEVSSSGRQKIVYKLINKEKDSVLYSVTHTNHRCSLWVRENSANYHWAFKFFCALSNEYTHRYGKVHKSYSKLSDILYDAPVNISRSHQMTPFALAMPKQYQNPSDAVESYRAYYNGDKRHLFSWKNRSIPHWIS